MVQGELLEKNFADRGSGYVAIKHKGLWVLTAREMPKVSAGEDKVTALDDGTQLSKRSTIPPSLQVQTSPEAVLHQEMPFHIGPYLPQLCQLGS